MKKHLVYADHAATTPLLPEALEAMLPWLKDGFGNPSSLHSFGREARKAVEAARAVVAACIGAETGEIFFTSGGTEANNWVIKGTSGALLVSAVEHHAVLNAAKAVAGLGRTVGLVKTMRDGRIGVRQLKAAMEQGFSPAIRLRPQNAPRARCPRSQGNPRAGRPRPDRLVSVMAANNETGAVNDIRALCRAAHECGALFHTDAVQAVGKIPVDVRTWGVDFLSASAHKFGGPKGVGFLYAKGGRVPARLLDGGAQERGARAGTENVAGIVGMAAALRLACERRDEAAVELRLT